MKKRIRSFAHKIRNSQAFGPYIMLFILTAINLVLQGRNFANVSSINSLFLVNTPLILATIAQAVIIFSGGIDLSIGATLSVVNATAIVLGTVMPVPLAWACAFLAAVLLGAVKGSIVAYLRVPAILVTFALSFVLEGVALLILPQPGGTIPSSVYSVYGGVFAAVIPISALVIICVLIFCEILNKRPLGAQIKAAGSNPRSLYIAGVNVQKTKMKAYIAAGAITGIAGLCLTILASSGDPKIGNALSLNTIAASILGGVSLSGGWGTVGGAASGALFLGVLNNLIFYIFNNVIKSSTIAGIKLSYLQQLLTNIIIILGLCSTLLAHIKKNNSRKGQKNIHENK